MELAAPTPRSGLSALTIAAIMAAIAIGGLLLGSSHLLKASVPPLNDHARNKHGYGAFCVYEWCKWISEEELEHYKWDCGDRYVFTVPMDTGRIGIYVTTLNMARTITSYPARSRNNIRRNLRGCSNDYFDSIDEVFSQLED